MCNIAGGGEGDAVIDAHNLFNKLADIDDDVSVIDKSNHFLGLYRSLCMFLLTISGVLDETDSTAGNTMNNGFVFIGAIEYYSCLDYCLSKLVVLLW